MQTNDPRHCRARRVDDVRSRCLWRFKGGKPLNLDDIEQVRLVEDTLDYHAGVDDSEPSGRHLPHDVWGNPAPNHRAIANVDEPNDSTSVSGRASGLRG